jgi:hypothetical protein
MTIVSAFVAGSVLYAGARTFFKYRHRKRFVWLLDDQGNRVPRETVIIDNTDPNQLAQRNDQDFSLATTSLTMTVLGTLVYSPLLLISLPLNIYNTIPMLEESFETVFIERTFRFVLVSSSVALAGLLTDLQNLVALIQWLHYLNRKLLYNMLAASANPVTVESVASAT